MGAACDFLTPIGHQCNTLVMAPGGYRFADYPRLGAPLTLLVLVVGTGLIAMVWPRLRQPLQRCVTRLSVSTVLVKAEASRALIWAPPPRDEAWLVNVSLEKKVGDGSGRLIDESSAPVAPYVGWLGG